MENIRIRYDRVGEDLAPKNTLATSTDGETIYFGISRCNFETDGFKKAKGKKKAIKRLEKAQGDAALYVVDGTLSVDERGLFGRVAVKDAVKMLEYFENIDQILFDLKGNL